jgi:DNA-binding transcriptional ArsR family regulator
MRFLHALRELLQTWQGVVLSILAVLGAIYYGPRKILETWDWYWDRFRDSEVFFVIERRKIMTQARSNYPITRVIPPAPIEFPYTVHEIAEYLGRKESSVRSSLKRLRRRGKVEPYQDGWRIKG